MKYDLNITFKCFECKTKHSFSLQEDNFQLQRKLNLIINDIRACGWFIRTENENTFELCPNCVERIIKDKYEVCKDEEN